MSTCGKRGQARLLFALISTVSLFLFTVVAHAATVTYSATISGVADATLLTLLESVSDTLAPEQAPPASLVQLKRRTERDEGRFMEVFQSRGFYNATIGVEIDRTATPVQVTFVAEPGPQFTLGALNITATTQAELPANTLPTSESVGLRPGDAALADSIVAADGKILRHLREQGYPLAQVVLRDVVVDKEAQTVAVHYTLNIGDAARFGDLQISGLETVLPEAVQKRVTWTVGDPYDERALTALRRNLYDTGLFSTATVTPLTANLATDARVPVLVEVLERKQRTVALGFEYNTDSGAGTTGHWEDRNVRGLGHRLSVDAAFSMELRNLGLRYRVERFRRDDQTLTFSGAITQEEREAYDSDRITALAMIDRKVTDKLSLGVGAGFRISEVRQGKDSDSFQLLYTPLTLDWDRSNDRLNPITGFRLKVNAEPYLGVLSSQSMFLKSDVEASHYFGFGLRDGAEGTTKDSWVLATRVKLGMIIGETRDGVPADIRYYGGGGGSVRGYAYQTLGPLRDNDPLGGRSLTEFSLEIRKRLSDDLGLVAFLDAGSAYESSMPDFSSATQFGAGVGLRYFTPVGPLRLDVAVPLNKRKEIDDAFQIYLSIGQAF